MPADDMPDANALLAQYPALGRIVASLTYENVGALLAAIDRRPDTQEKFARFRAIEFLGLRVYEAAYETVFGSPCDNELDYTLAEEGRYRGREVWRRLNGDRGPYFIDSDEVYEGIISYANMPMNTDPAVLNGFVNDTELMGILGLEARWTPRAKEINPTLGQQQANDNGIDL